MAYPPRYIIQIRRDTAANWQSVDPILAQGEIGLELDTYRFKIGDGIRVWTLLPYPAVTDHPSLTNLDYSTAGHTGFQKALSWDNDYQTAMLPI
jgi:hypothetical protein